MKYTAQDAHRFGCVDEVVQEPSGGTHVDVDGTMAVLDSRLRHHLAELRGMPIDRMLDARYGKFRAMAQFYTTA